MHYWIEHEKNDELFFRYDGDDVRAIFTTQYRPVDNFEVLEDVSYELGKQKHQFKLSMESLVDDPLKTIESFNRQFQLKEPERKAVVEFVWPH